MSHSIFHRTQRREVSHATLQKKGGLYIPGKKKVTKFEDFSLKVTGQLREGLNEALGV